MIHRLLKAHLEPVETRRRRFHLWCHLAVCWTGAAFLGLGLVALQRWSGLTSSLALPVVALTGLAAAAYVLARRQPDPDWHDLAQQIEETHPDLNSRLLTAVQQREKGATGLNYLQDRLIREAALHSQRNDWLEVLPKSRMTIAHTAHLLAIVLFASVLWQLRVTGGHVLLAKRTESPVTVTPGDTSIERGSSLVVLARFTGPLPANVELAVNSPGNSEQRIPLVKSLADPVFGGNVPEVTTDFVYHVEYAGQRTKDFKVTVFEHPRLERADADLTFPEYTGQAPKHIDNTRRVTAVEGSHLGLTLQLNKPVTSARLVARGKEATVVPLQVASNQPIATLRQFPLKASQTYELQLVDADGRANKMPAQFVFAVLTNRTPELRLALPRGDIRPSPLEEITFDGTVWDDFGVKDYGLAYTLVGQPTKFVELGKTVPGKEKKSFHYKLRLEDLGVQPDQLVSWFTWADDVGPDGKVRRTPGDLFFGEVRPFDEIFRQGQDSGMNAQRQQQQSGGQSGQQGGGQAGRLAELQKQIINATWNLQRQHPGDDNSAPASDAKPSGSSKPLQDQSAIEPEQAAVYFPVVRQFAGQIAPGSSPMRPANRTGANDPSARSPGATPAYPDDTTVVHDAQAQALDQARTAMQRQQDPRTVALWQAAIQRMEQAEANLKKASGSPASLAEALTEEQAAYQALLKLQQHEFSVVRSQNQSQNGQSSRDRQMQRQLDQLDLTQPQNRFETQSQAQAPQSAQRSEQLQVMNRLQELARRQQDLNDRLKELQASLQEARTPQEREEIQRQLKRLEEEEQQMLADVDQLRQQMDQSQNQSNMSQARQQLDQTRNEIQRAAQAASQSDASQALAAGTRAQRQLQNLRDQLRQENSSQFAQDLREMRGQARQLAQQQQDILNTMEQQANSEHKSLSDSSTRDTLAELTRQKELMTNLVARAEQVSQDAESSEPLLSRQLYDTVRKFSQDSSKNANEVQDDLLNRGLMTQSLYNELQDTSVQAGPKLLDASSELLRLGFLPQANDIGQRSLANINDLKRGVERAAESVLGDDTDALRLAQQQLNQLTDQLQQEIARGEGATRTNQGPAQAAGAQGQNSPESNGSQQARSGNPGQRQNQPGQDQTAQAGNGSRNSGQPGGNQQAQAGNRGERQNQTAQAGGGQNGQGRSGSRDNAGQQRNGAQPSDQETASAQEQQQQGGNANPQSGQRSGQPNANGQGRNGNQRQVAQNGRNGGRRGDTAQRGQRGGGNQAGGNGGNLGGDLGNAFDRLVNNDTPLGGGPITGENYLPWANRLRDVQDMIDTPDLRNEVATARDRARLLRQAFKQNGQMPDWAAVRMQVVKPLVDVQNRIAEELARRTSQDALVPIDRDPVPTRYSELVRRYYEELGKDK